MTADSPHSEKPMCNKIYSIVIQLRAVIIWVHKLLLLLKVAIQLSVSQSMIVVDFFLLYFRLVLQNKKNSGHTYYKLILL